LTRSFTYNGTTLTPAPLEYLFLVNGLDDNGDGLIDSGWDGIDNNADGLTDELVPQAPVTSTEWEVEAWDSDLARPPSLVVSSPVGVLDVNTIPVPRGYLNLGYTITRRPIPSPNQKETPLPSNVVVDLTTWGNANPERSRLPVNRFSGYVDILVSPQGDLVPSTPYSTPASLGMANAFFHFWLAERSDLYAVQTDSNGNPVPLVTNYPFFLPMPVGSNVPPQNAYDLLVAGNSGLQSLKGEIRLVTLFTRSGQVTTVDSPVFDVNNVSRPFIAPQQGARGGP
jgi:hypothetical protein